MPLLQQAFSLGVKAGTVLPLMTAKGTGNALLNAITKGSADQAAKGDYEYQFGDEALINVDVSEPRLFGTAAIGGALYGMLVYRFYQRLELANRLKLTSEFLADVRKSIDIINQRLEIIGRMGDEIAKGMTVVEYEMKLTALTTQNGIIGTERRKLDAYVLMLENLNDVSVEQVVRQNKLQGVQLSQLNAVDDILKSSNIKGLDPEDLGALKQLLDPDDALGMKTTLNTVSSYLGVLDDAIRNSQAVEKSATNLVSGGTLRLPTSEQIKAMGMKISGSQSLAVSKATASFKDDKLDKRLTRIGDASDDLNFKSGKLAGSTIGRIAGRVLLVDTIIWGVSLGIDLGLNLFLTEEEQADIPLIGFFFEGAGWSPIGAIIEGVIDFFVAPDTQETLFDIFIATLVAASRQPLLENAVIMILNFYVNEISAELLVPLSFGRELDVAGFSMLGAIDPLRILEVFAYACVGKIVFKAWIMPSFAFFQKQLRYAA